MFVSISISVITDCYVQEKGFGKYCSDHWRKAQAIWLQNTLLLPQRVKSNSDQGFALLSSGEKPCPLSLSHGFSPYSHRQAGTRKRGQATFSLRKRKSLLMDRTTEKVACPLFLRWSRASSMSEPSELRRRREERMENGVKNLKGARLFPRTFPNHGFGDASLDRKKGVIYFFLTRTWTQEAIATPWPISPSPSFVLAFIPKSSLPTPRIGRKTSFIWWI